MELTRAVLERCFMMKTLLQMLCLPEVKKSASLNGSLYIYTICGGFLFQFLTKSGCIDKVVYYSPVLSASSNSESAAKTNHGILSYDSGKSVYVAFEIDSGVPGETIAHIAGSLAFVD